jgi:hypothetical protein
MKRAATKKNGDPQPCNHRYRVWLEVKWSGTRHCKKPVGHTGPCGTGTIK